MHLFGGAFLYAENFKRKLSIIAIDFYDGALSSKMCKCTGFPNLTRKFELLKLKRFEFMSSLMNIILL